MTIKLKGKVEPFFDRLSSRKPARTELFGGGPRPKDRPRRAGRGRAIPAISSCRSPRQRGGQRAEPALGDRRHSRADQRALDATVAAAGEPLADDRS